MLMLNEFNIIIDCQFSALCSDSSLEPINNKKVLSILNDFENGKWRYNKFIDFIWNNISETALTEKERQAHIHSNFTTLRLSAEKLRLSDDGGEIGEILLYAIMRNHYNALPIVPKIFYKQNKNDPAKGADSVHIVIENENTFSLWLGEAKFYNSIEDARFYEILDSVNSLLDLEKLKKENSIITNLNELKDFEEINDSLKEKILRTLAQQESIDTLKPILHIPILLLHECEITAGETHYTENYIEKIKEFHKDRTNSYFRKQINRCKNIDMYSKIHFHLILFPVPNKESIVSNFTEKANAFRR